MEVNQEKRAKFMENAGKRVNKVMHDIEILEPMSRSSVYDFTKDDVEEMFCAMQNALDTAKAEFGKKFEGRAKSERKLFSFGTVGNQTSQNSQVQEGNNGTVEANNIQTDYTTTNTTNNNINTTTNGIEYNTPTQNTNLDETVENLNEIEETL